MTTHGELIIVIGHKGMLGSDLLMGLRASGREALGLDMDELDITRREDALKRIRELAPTIVFNTAAFTDVDGCESQREKAFQVNGEGPGHLAEACALNNCRLVHISTDYVFDGSQRIPYKEDTPTSPLGVYGESKLMGEESVKSKLPEQHCIVRTEWLFGTRGKNFVEAILNQTEKTDLLRVVDDQTGAPTYTPDLAHALIRLADSGATGVTHVTNSGSVTWMGFAEEILNIRGIDSVRVTPISSGELARPAKRPSYSVLDCSRYERLTNSRMRDWKEALRAYMTERDS